MKCAVEFNVYELTIYKVFGDGSKRAICRVYEDNNFLHLDVRADNWKYLNEMNNTYHMLERDMVGVDLRLLYDELVEHGMTEL